MKYNFGAPLRYYAPFKVRKFESLFYKNQYVFPKNYHLHWTAGRANILCKYLIYFFNFGRGFCSSSYVNSRSSSLLWCRNFEIIFGALYYFCELKKCLTFKILFQTGDINSFGLLGAFFTRFVRLKSSSSAKKKKKKKKNSSAIWDTFVEKLSKFDTTKT